MPESPIEYGGWAFKNCSLQSFLYKHFKNMKYVKPAWKRQADETEAEDSWSVRPPARKQGRRRRGPRYPRQRKRLAVVANYIKILRFRAPHLGKTLRVYCYDEDALGWPIRFTKKVREMACDNDCDSDEEGIEHDKQKCLASLFQAIQHRKAASSFYIGS